MARMSLPPGFRFYPTDVELLMYYLKRKVMGKKFQFEAIAEVNIYKFSPSDLPDKSCLRSKDLEWYFFCPREKKYASGARVKRDAKDGYWKTTGKSKLIQIKDKTVGTRTTLVFHLGHAPSGERTNWVIHEYLLRDDQLAADGVQDTYVLCKLFEKAGVGPKNGAQYGAPFNEDLWADYDDIDDSQSHAEPITSAAPFPITPMQPENQTHPLVTSSLVPGSTSDGLPLTETLSASVGQPISEVLVDENDGEIDGEIARLLDPFTDDDMLLSNESGNHQDDFMDEGKNKWLLSPDEYGIYNNLGDLDGWTRVNEGKINFSRTQEDVYSLNNVPMEDAFIELNDFLSPLNCSPGAIGPVQSSVSEIFGSYNHDNMQNVQLGSCSVVNQFTSGASQLYALPGEPSIGNNCLYVHQMVNDQFHEGSNAAYDLGSAHGEQMYDGVMFNDMERGTLRKIEISRLMELVPARTPSAAVCLTLSFSPPNGGSSMHIKAEVTHGADECTDEALLFMMEESGSGCWCNLPLAEFYKDTWLHPRNNLLTLFNFGFFHLVYLVCCYFDDDTDYIRRCLNFNPSGNSFIIVFLIRLWVVVICFTHMGNPAVINYTVEVTMAWPVSLGICFVNSRFPFSAKSNFVPLC